MRLRFDHKRTFAPRAEIHLALATILTAVLGLLFLAAQAFAVGPVNIPGPLHPDPLAPAGDPDPTLEAYAMCGGLLDDYVAGAAFIIPIPVDEGEGRSARRARERLLKTAARRGWGACTTPGLLWIGAGIDIDPEGGWIKPGIIRQGGR